MHAWEAIQKTLDHIEANLAETIEIDELAKVIISVYSRD